MRRILIGLTAFVALTGTMVVLPVYAAPGPDVVPVAPTLESVELGSVAAPEDDVLVVGLPDEKYGQSVAAVVEPRPGHEVELEELRTFLRAHLSGYKLPRSVTYVDSIPRSPTGKANYPEARRLATQVQAREEVAT